jgi:hypothetical protein
LKVKVDVLRVSALPAVVVTFRVTVAVCVPEGVVKVIVPAQDVPAARPD